MAFSATLARDGSTAIITLAGELDASVAPLFRAEVERAASEHLERLVLMVRDLTHIASAGLRVLLFAQQKMGQHVDVYVVGAREQVINVLQMTGFDRSCILADTYA